MTKHTLAEDKRPQEMTLIVYHLHEHKLQADSRVTLWPSTNAHLCRIPAARSRAYPEEPGHIPFLSQRSMRIRICILLEFLKDLVRGAATWTKTALTIFQF